MNFHQFSFPTPKRNSADSSLRAFPVDRIDNDNQKPFIGIFNGLSVEIIDSGAIKQLHSNGCFGLSTKTKTTPQLLFDFARTKNVNQKQYDQKLAWNAQFTNQNPKVVMVNMLPPDENRLQNTADRAMKSSEEEIRCRLENVDGDDQLKNSTEYNENVENSNEPEETEETDNAENQPESMEIVDEKNEPELNSMVDPFPIEETLALLLEEAFFLHFSLRCLKIIDFDQTHEFTTEQLLEAFCKIDAKFIERFVVYHYYRSKNWVVKSGLKFGGDFLLYYKGPNYYHASYVVLVSDNENELNHLDVQSNYRVSESTNKEIILTNVTRPANLDYPNPLECLHRLSEFKITEILPKRFLLNQLTAVYQKA